MVRHGLHAALAGGHELRDGAQVLLGDVDRHALHGFAEDAVDLLGDDLRLADGELEALAAHLLHQDRQGELATALDLPGIGALGGQNLQGHVADELAVEAVLDLAGRDLGALDAAGHGRGVDADGHGDGRVVHRDEREGTRVLEVDEGLADHDVFDAGDGDDVTGGGGVGGHALEALGGQQLGDVDALDGAVVARQANVSALLQGAVVDAQQGETAQERGGVQVGDVGLQRHVLVVGGAGDTVQDGLEQGLEVLGGQLAVTGVFQRALAGLSGGVDDGDVHEGVHVDVDAFVHEVLAQRQEQVGRLGDDLLDTRVGAVDLVDDDDDGQVGLEGLAQHEAGLRERALGGIDHEDDAVNHRQASLDLAAEVGVAGGVDDVDDDAILEAQGLGGGAGVVDGGVLGENGDALLALEVAGVHNALAGLFDRVTLGERSGLPEHCVNQRGLAMIDVRDDGDISQVGTRGHMWTPQMWIQIYACEGAKTPQTRPVRTDFTHIRLQEYRLNEGQRDPRVANSTTSWTRGGDVRHHRPVYLLVHKQWR